MNTNHSVIICCYLYALLFFAAQPQSSAAQNRTVIDSLKTDLARSQGEVRVVTLNALCWEYRTFDQTKAIEYGLQALGLAEQMQFKSGMASAYNNLGIVYRRRGNFPQALDYHLKALKISEEIKDSSDIGQALNRIGLIYQGQANYNAALEYFERAQKLYEKTGDINGTGTVLTNIGEIYSRQGKYSLALEFLVKSNAIYQQTGDVYGTAESLLEIGLIYSKQGNTGLALDYLQRANKLYEQTGNKSGVAQTLSVLSATYLQIGDVAGAETLALRSLGYARDIGEIEWMRQSSKTLYGVYARKKDYQQALTYQTLYTTLKDSTMGEESIRKITDLEAMLVSEKQQAQMERLTKEREIQQLIRNSLAVGLILVFVLAYVLFRSNHQQKKVNVLLSEQNTEILRQQTLLEEQASEIQLANTELHEANLNLKRQQEILEEQTREIEMVNNELLELNISLENKQRILETQATQIEAANTELHKRNEQLNEVNEQLNDFLGIAAHDLKNPLASIVMSASAIKRYFARMTKEDILDMIGNVEATAERMRIIIHNLLEINTIESGNLRVASEPVSPGEIAEKVVHDWDAKAAHKTIKLHFDNRAPEKFFMGDPNIFHQILENLVSNAVKYSPPVRNVWVRVLASDISSFAAQQTNGTTQHLVAQRLVAQQFVRVEVQDEGPGLTNEDKVHLFGKFVRLSAQPTGGEHSTGLGLSIVKKLVEAMHGNVWCDSKLHKGATFIVEFSVPVV
jgi:signal transduction histidine kinase